MVQSSLRSWLRKVLLGWVILILVITPACSSQPQIVYSPLRVGWSDWSGDYIFVLAEQLGLYEKYGVAVDLYYRETYQDNVIQFASGFLDTTNFQIGDILFLTSSNDLKVVAILDSSNGADFVVATGDINSPVDLKGKRIGARVGNIYSELLIQEMLKKFGLSVLDVELVNISPEKVAGNLGKTIDAGHTWAPYDEEALRMGNKVVFSSAETQNLFQDVIAFRKDLLTNRSQDARAFLAAVLEAADYWNDNPEQASQLIADYITTNIRPTLIGEISSEGAILYGVQDNARLFAASDDPGSVLYSFKLTIDYMISQSSLSREVDLNDLLDSSYLPTPTE